MTRILQNVERNKASQGKRLANYLIDPIIFYMVFTAIFFIIGVLSGDLEGFMTDIENTSRWVDTLRAMAAYFVFMFFIKYITKGRSIGKYITGSMAIKTDGSLLTLTDFLLRNLCHIVPFDALSFLGTNGWHDGWSHTSVVNKKAYEDALLSNSEINEIRGLNNS